MEQKKDNQKQEKPPAGLLRFVVLLAPLAGIALFVLLYLLAAGAYPGGSYANPEQEGFSYRHNYLCDLLDEEAINGELNTSRHFARWSLGILCASLLVLWYQIPQIFDISSKRIYFIRFSGILALGTLVFLSDGTHDRIVWIAGAFGVLALIICTLELYWAGYRVLYMLSVLNLLIFLLNYYIYETGIFLKALPMIQKLTFVLFLLWFVLLDLALYRKFKV
jgi:hypothetical protein